MWFAIKKDISSDDFSSKDILVLELSNLGAITMTSNTIGILLITGLLKPNHWLLKTLKSVQLDQNITELRLLFFSSYIQKLDTALNWAYVKVQFFFFCKDKRNYTIY